MDKEKLKKSAKKAAPYVWKVVKIGVKLALIAATASPALSELDVISEKLSGLANMDKFIDGLH